MNKNYKIKPTKKQLRIMKAYWEKFQIEQDVFWGRMSELEKEMSRETGIKGLEFFHDQSCTGWVGIGNADRTIKLLQFDWEG